MTPDRPTAVCSREVRKARGLYRVQVQDTVPRRAPVHLARRDGNFQWDVWAIARIATEDPGARGSKPLAVRSSCGMLINWDSTLGHSRDGQGEGGSHGVRSQRRYR